MGATALIVAAGTGERLGAGVAKAFAVLAGEPLLFHAARAFAASESVTGVAVVLPGDAGGTLRDDVARLLRRAGVTEPILCPGGATRQESVSRGLEHCGVGVELVAVHDAARPLVSPRLIDRTVAALVPPWDAVAPGLPVAETVKVVDPTRQAVLRTIDRQGLWTVQTPQVFRRVTLARVHARVATSADAATDDLSLVERAGGRVRLIEGERRNLKVTFPGDLELAEALLRGGG